VVATARAAANIAFVKYWGNRCPALNLPANSSISLTLSNCTAVTTVAVDGSLNEDVVYYGTSLANDAVTARVRRFLGAVRQRARREEKARVQTSNNFPVGCGIASSAAGFAALALAASRAYGLLLDTQELSCLARLGSGSACRSVLGGFVEWVAGTSHETSCARQLADHDHWPELRDIVVIVSKAPKEQSSSEGHALAPTSPLYEARLAYLGAVLETTRRAIATRDLRLLGEVLEPEAFCLHAIAMTTSRPVLYWTPETVDVLRRVFEWRRQGLEAYCTLDAGPNVHIITVAEVAAELVPRLRAHGYNELIVDRPGPGAQLLSQPPPQ